MFSSDFENIPTGCRSSTYIDSFLILLEVAVKHVLGINSDRKRPGAVRDSKRKNAQQKSEMTACLGLMIGRSA